MDKGKVRFGRLNREKWLEKALGVVAAKGGARLRIDSLVAAMGVSKGSFTGTSEIGTILFASSLNTGTIITLKT